MQAIKIDFVPEDTKSYCGNGVRLSSGKAYFLKDNNGAIHLGGRQCAEKLASNDLSQIPDLTKSLVARRDGQSTGGGEGAHSNARCNIDKSNAITYLLLRQEKLIEYNCNGLPLPYEKLAPYYQEYISTSDLPVTAIQHILNIENYSSNKISKKLSLKNLSTCYAYQYILERTLYQLNKEQNQDGVRFVNDLLNGTSGLKMRCSLSQGQVDGLAKWLQFLPKDLRETKLKEFSVHRMG